MRLASPASWVQTKAPLFASQYPSRSNITHQPKFGAMDLFQRKYPDAPKDAFMATLKPTSDLTSQLIQLYREDRQAVLNRVYLEDPELPAGKREMTGESVLKAVQQAQNLYTPPGEALTTERFVNDLGLFNSDSEKQAVSQALKDLEQTEFLQYQPKKGHLSKQPNFFVFKNDGLQEEIQLSDLGQVALDKELSMLDTPSPYKK